MKRERVYALACIICALLMLALILIIDSTREEQRQPVDFTAYIVEEGDTLWRIAAQSNAFGVYDTRRIVSDICEASDCSADIYEGQEIYVPQYDIEKGGAE